MPPLTIAEKAKFTAFVKPDTIIDAVSHKRYGIRRLDKKVGIEYHYSDGDIILLNGTDFHLPNFFSAFLSEEMQSATAGIPREVFIRNRYMNRREYIFNYLNHSPIKKYIVIPDDCDSPIPKSKKMRRGKSENSLNCADY